MLLLDEPLGALDLKLREEMQLELKAIQQEVGITFIYVTHDQEEALTMSDRLAVFNRGPDRAARHARGPVRAPGDAPSSPASSGTSNLLRGEAARDARRRGRHCSPSGRRRSGSPSAGAPVADDEVGADGTIRNVVYLGPDTRYIVTLDAGSRARRHAAEPATSSMEALAAQGQPVRLVWKRQHVLRVNE